MPLVISTWPPPKLAAYTPFYAIYPGSKAAVEHYTRAASKEFGGRGISVNAVGPGPMDTPFFYGQETPERVVMKPGRTRTEWPSPRGAVSVSSGSEARKPPSSGKARSSSAMSNLDGGVMARHWARRLIDTASGSVIHSAGCRPMGYHDRARKDRAGG